MLLNFGGGTTCRGRKDLRAKVSLKIKMRGNKGKINALNLKAVNTALTEEDSFYGMPRAFEVEGEPDFSGPPKDGLEYLRRVAWERKDVAKVVHVAIDEHKVAKQTRFFPTFAIDRAPACSPSLLPSPHWQAEFSQQFLALRQALFRYTLLHGNSIENSQFESGSSRLSSFSRMSMREWLIYCIGEQLVGQDEEDRNRLILEEEEGGLCEDLEVCDGDEVSDAEASSEITSASAGLAALLDVRRMHHDHPFLYPMNASPPTALNTSNLTHRVSDCRHSNQSNRSLKFRGMRTTSNLDERDADPQGATHQGHAPGLALVASRDQVWCRRLLETLHAWLQQTSGKRRPEFRPPPLLWTQWVP
jgi:hypothetical protein